MQRELERLRRQSLDLAERLYSSPSDQNSLKPSHRHSTRSRTSFSNHIEEIDIDTNLQTLLRQRKEKQKADPCRDDQGRTIPKPFALTVRPKRESSSIRRLRKDLAAMAAKESEECAKQFVAQSVPAAVLLPKYNEIVRKHSSMSNSVRKQRAEEILKSVQPFNFTETKKRTRLEQVRFSFCNEDPC